MATLPRKTELYDLASDIGEQTNIADRHRTSCVTSKFGCFAYARQQKPSEWIKAQPQFLGAQGETVFDPDFDIDDAGLAHEKPAIPSARM